MFYVNDIEKHSHFEFVPYLLMIQMSLSRLKMSLRWLMYWKENWKMLRIYVFHWIMKESEHMIFSAKRKLQCENQIVPIAKNTLVLGCVNIKAFDITFIITLLNDWYFFYRGNIFRMLPCHNHSSIYAFTLTWFNVLKYGVTLVFYKACGSYDRVCDNKIRVCSYSTKYSSNDW